MKILQKSVKNFKEKFFSVIHFYDWQLKFVDFYA